MDPHALFNLYWISQTLLTGVRLGLFDRLAAGPQTSVQMAQSLGLNPAATGRLLRALTALGMVQQQGPLYSNSPTAARTLVKGAPEYVGGIADHHAELLWPLWGNLPTAVREGRPVLREVFGGDRNPFDVVSRSPESLIKFLAGMHAGARNMGNALAQAHNWSNHRHVLDVGGGSGAIAGPLAQRHRHLRVTVMDLAPVVAALPVLVRPFGCGERIAAHAGDFFRPETFPAGCDAAVLSRVLHDWDDQKAVMILRNTHRALVPGGVALIMEHALDDADPGGRLFAALSDLTMLVLTDGGQERTGPAYEALLAKAGFRSLGTVRLPGALIVTKGQKLQADRLALQKSRGY